MLDPDAVDVLVEKIDDHDEDPDDRHEIQDIGEEVQGHDKGEHVQNAREKHGLASLHGEIHGLEHKEGLVLDRLLEAVYKTERFFPLRPFILLEIITAPVHGHAASYGKNHH